MQLRVHIMFRMKQALVITYQHSINPLICQNSTSITANTNSGDLLAMQSCTVSSLYFWRQAYAKDIQEVSGCVCMW